MNTTERVSKSDCRRNLKQLSGMQALLIRISGDGFRIGRSSWFGLALFCLLNAQSVDLLSPLAADDEVRFNRDIRPILSDKCFACHGPDAKHAAADLRLDDSGIAIQAGAIVPKHPEQSELISRIFAEDSDVIMPPADSHKPLTDDERQLIKRWIQQGAEYEPHWAYAPVRRVPRSFSGNPIDHFVAEMIAEAGMTPVAQADRITLIRRLSFDLNGMPPTLEEVEDFVNDESKDAYPRLVGRLLDSPRFGERMAAYWLDLVRYADTVGYHGDQDISQWAFRDYVIDAFNNNVPYDQFIREQLAGDLLPNATTEQLIASGYNRLNQTTEEGGSQAKEYLAIYFADRVRNASQVFMGSTLGCAQCHDHKYDPFTAKDFYSFGAFFADLNERGVYGGRGARPPVLPIPTDEQNEEIARLGRLVDAATRRKNELRKSLLEGIDGWSPGESVEVVMIDDERPAAKSFSGAWTFVSGDSHPVHSGSRSRQQHGAGLVQHYFNESSQPVRINSAAKFYTWVYLDPTDPPNAVMVQFNDGSTWNHRAIWGDDAIVYGKRDASWAGYFRMGPLPEAGKWVKLEVDTRDVGLFKDGSANGNQTVVSGVAFTQFGGRVWWDKLGWVDAPPQELIDALAIPNTERTSEQQHVIDEFYLASSDEFVAQVQRVADAENRLKQAKSAIPTTVISESVKPREIRILPRGNWMDDSGEVVVPAIPAFLGSLNVGERRATRLDLANWLTQADNPLTARTMVNRLWSLMFGRGICTSVDDFGGQGTYPSNPDLLDALATEFIDSGWDIRHVIRLIVESKAYQRSSVPTEILRDSDPYNEFFARQGRFRIDAEMIRDSALLVSGQLVEKVGGPSVKPYQPAGYYAQLNFPKRKYSADQGRNQNRRGLYTHWQRTFLHPMLKAFDAPSREECTARRPRSSTPLQALTLMNDPTFVEAARVFAARILDEGGETEADRIVWAYRAAVSHHPNDEIVQALSTIYRSHVEIYEVNLEAATRLLKVGQTPAPADLDPVELAAWTGVARTIMNLHETTTRY